MESILLLQILVNMC